jgi:hypothetical protein
MFWVAASAATLIMACGREPLPVSREPPAVLSHADTTRLDIRTVDSTALDDFEDEYEDSIRNPRPVFDKYLPALGAAAMLDFLELRYPGCHAQSHELGQALFAMSRDLETALRRCDTRCTSGCMHGVVTEALGGADVGALTARMEEFCREGEMASLHRPGNCAHGLGHALMFVTGGSVDRSIDGCLGFGREAMQYYCASGVFMEQFVRDSTRGRAAPSLLAPCDAEALFPGACYRYKGAQMLATLGGTDEVAAECGRLEDLQRRGCFHGLGYAAITLIMNDPERLTRVCADGSRDDQVVCIEGVVEKLADVNEGRAKGACAFIENGMRPVCDAAVQRKMYALENPTFGLYFDRHAIARRRTSIGIHSGPSEHVH